MLFQKGISGNPKGTKKKLVGDIIVQLRAEGYERVTGEQIMHAYETLLNLDETRLVELINDKEQAMVLRIVGKSMLDNKKGFEIIQAMLERVHGKARQPVDTDNKITVTWVDPPQKKQDDEPVG